MTQHLFPLLLAVLLLAGCTDPLPEDKLDYAGDWRAPGMSLLILEDGSVAYERIRSGATTSVNGPLKAFDGDDFAVGVWFFTTTFEVSEPPHQVDGAWQMVVDGVRLTKQAW